MEDLIGALAAVLTTAAFIPQAVKVLREKDTAAISLGMYAIFTAGVALWLVYGLLLGKWPIIVANIITLSLAFVILAAKIRYG